MKRRENIREGSSSGLLRLTSHAYRQNDERRSHRLRVKTQIEDSAGADEVIGPGHVKQL